MANSPTEDRIRRLNDKPARQEGKCVIYVMSRDQRVSDNHAMAVAQQAALSAELPLVVMFCVMPSTGHRAREHYEFMLDGLRRVADDLHKKQIAFDLRVGAPKKELRDAFKAHAPEAVYFDMNPLRGPQALHASIAEQAARVPVYEVDAHNIVPVWIASGKQETAARTFRRPIMDRLDTYLDDNATISKHPHKYGGSCASFDDVKRDLDALLDKLPSNQADYSAYRPGEAAAHTRVRDFVKNRLKDYATARNDPSDDGQSGLSPYLHYGQLASAAVIRAAREAAASNKSLQAGVVALTEEMVVRKELSDNFCFYNQKYDSLDGAPEWAQKTLQKHQTDTREHTYTTQQFDAAETHDDAWNAAQRQIRTTGKIHGYMRMYWAKKVLEWSKDPATALKTLLYLNDRYHIDGGDPNGYVGILWSIAGLHDRPWFERPVYGQIRYMNANGLKRKYDIAKYIAEYVPEKDREGLDGAKAG